MTDNPMQMTAKWLDVINFPAEERVKLEKLGLVAEDFVDMDAGVLVELLKDGGLSVTSIIQLMKSTDEIPEQT